VNARRYLIFFIAGLAVFMSAVDSTIVATALPRIGSALHSRLNWTGWIITIYSLGLIIALPLAGKISDQFGRKRVFLSCIALFTVSSIACGLSTNIYMLIALRFFQGLGGGAFMPSAAGLIADNFGPDRDRGIGLISSITPIGQITGPVVGGLITQYWVWRGIFFVNVPIGIALLILAFRFIPRHSETTAERFDFPGVAYLISTIVAGMLTITFLGEPGATLGSIKVLIAACIAISLGWQFVRHERRADAPLIPMQLIRGKGFLTMNFLNFLYGTALIGFAALVPLYAENRYHIPISQAGTVMSARALGAISVATISTMMLRRVGYRLPMTIGFLVIASGLVMISIAPIGITPYWWIAIFSVVAGIGLGCAAPATNNATLQLAPNNIAAITGLRGMFRQIGGIIYVSISTALLARSGDPGMMQARIFVIQAIVLALMTLLVLRVPNHRGRW